MVSVVAGKGEIRVSIPTAGMPRGAADALLGWLRAEVVARQSQLTEDKAWILAEDVKADWWEQNKTRFPLKKAR